MTPATAAVTPTSNGAAATLVVLAAGRAKRYGGLKALAPVGLMGEAVIDVLASDAIAAGYTRMVLVVGPETGAAVRYHVERTWPSALDVRFAVQPVPRGTVDAVLAAMEHLDDASFGVANADDIYGERGLTLLAAHLRGPDPASALVCYTLRATLVGEKPVTRGVCDVAPDGLLRSLTERRLVTPLPDGRIVARDGREPVELDGGSPVSMNLWGLRPHVRGVLERALARDMTDSEVLLPEVVGDLVAHRDGTGTGVADFRALMAPGRCIGVTHPGDLAPVQAELAAEVGRGERAGQLWAAPAPAR
jgi:hypothetical protein